MDKDTDLNGSGVSMEALNNLGDAFDVATGGTDFSDEPSTNQSEETDNSFDDINDPIKESFKDEGSTQTYDQGDDLGADVFNINDDEDPVEKKEESEKTDKKVAEEEDSEEEDELGDDPIEKDSDKSDSDDEDITKEADELIKNPTVKVKTRNYITKLVNRVKELQEQVDGKADPELTNEKVREIESKYEEAIKENSLYRRKLQIENHPHIEEKFSSEQNKIQARLEKMLIENGLNQDETFEEIDGEKEELLSLALINKNGGIRKYFQENPETKRAILDSLPDEDAYLVRQLLAKQKEIDIEKSEYIDSIVSDESKFDEISKANVQELMKGVEESISEFEANQFVSEINIDSIEDENKKANAIAHNERSKQLKQMYRDTMSNIINQKADIAEIAQVAVTSYYFRDQLDQAIKHIERQNETIANLRKADNIKASGRVRSTSAPTPRKAEPADMAKLSLDHAFDASMDSMFNG